MIEGYHKSMKKDEKENIYNPLNSNTWDYTTLKKELVNKLSKSNTYMNFIDLENYSWS